MQKIFAKESESDFIIITQIKTDENKHPVLKYARSKLGKRVQIYTGCDREAYGALIEKIDFFPVFVDYSGTALTITEVIHSGCVPIIVKKPWTSPRFDGYFLRVNFESELLQALLVCAKNPVEIKKRAESFIEEWRKRYTDESIGKNWSDLIDIAHSAKCLRYEKMNNILFSLAGSVIASFDGESFTESEFFDAMVKRSTSPATMRSILKANSHAILSAISCKRLATECNGRFYPVKE